MEARQFSDVDRVSAAESERLVAWIRIAALPVLALGETIPHPDPNTSQFYVVLAAFSVFAVGVLATTYVRSVGRQFAVVTTMIDIATITALAILSGGAYSPARLAFFLIPVTVAFRFRPALTTVSVIVALAAYLVHPLLHHTAGVSGSSRNIAVGAAYLALVGAAAVLLSYALERRTTNLVEVATDRERLQEQLTVARRRLMADALAAEERERQALAESLHDSAIQNLLSARHELEEAAEVFEHPALGRADVALTNTISDLREAIFELHPYVLDEAGLDVAVRTVAERAARRGRFNLRCRVDRLGSHPNGRLLLSAGRELLANVVEHAGARNVTVRLTLRDARIVLEVEDDGSGFDAEAVLPSRVAEGHIGLASQRERVESADGSFEVQSEPGRGTRIVVSLPAGGDTATLPPDRSEERQKEERLLRP